MLAGHFFQPRRIELLEIPEPDLKDAAPGDVIFRPELACLCGSDLPYFEGNYKEFKPQIGQSLHEMIGAVVESRSERFAVGDRVLCVPQNHFGMLQRYRITDRNLVPLPPGTAPEQILMSQPLGTVICALRKLPSLIGRDVAVVGQGPMGQLFCAALRVVGVRNIVAIEPIAERLAVSAAMGATHSIDSSSQDPVEAVREITEGAMCDLVVEAVGHREQTLNLCAELCRPQGQLLSFGVPCETIDQLQWGRVFWKNLSIHTSVGPDFQIDFPLAMRWIAEGRVDVRPLLTHRFPLERIEEAFELFYQRREGVLKVLIDFPGFPAA